MCVCGLNSRLLLPFTSNKSIPFPRLFLSHHLVHLHETCSVFSFVHFLTYPFFLLSIFFFSTFLLVHLSPCHGHQVRIDQSDTPSYPTHHSPLIIVIIIIILILIFNKKNKKNKNKLDEKIESTFYSSRYNAKM